MTSRNDYFTVRPLEIDDARDVADLLQRQPPEYSRFFYAFASSEPAIAALLAARVKDCYAGLYWNGAMVGFYMLRGWDAGYEVPSFGILIDDKHRGGSFMRISLDIAKMTARLAGAPRLMAKIHPDNVSPLGAKRLGLVETGREEVTGNIIYHHEL